MPGYVESTQQLVTEIFVRDIHSSVQFYRRLGFEVFRENGTFAVLTWENHRLFLDQRDDLPPLPVFPQANMRVMVPNVDDYWKLAGKIGAPVLSPIADPCPVTFLMNRWVGS